MNNTLPSYFCWTRFGTEAGEPIDQIIARKEQERLDNNGIFFWGIGNALAPSMRELLKLEQTPEVIFSPIISRPKLIDVLPPSIVKWTSALNLNDEPFDLPKGTKITSRITSPRHYALVCYSDRPLILSTAKQSFSINNLRNLLTDKRVGGSQVSAIVKCSNNENDGTQYNVAFRAQLIEPFFIKLLNPKPLI